MSFNCEVFIGAWSATVFQGLVIFNTQFGTIRYGFYYIKSPHKVCHKEYPATETGGSKDKQGPPFAALHAVDHEFCSLIITDLQHNLTSSD